MTSTRGRRAVTARAAAGIPTLVGMPIGPARKLASRSGLTVGVAIRRDVVGAWGHIVSQYPAAGTSTRPSTRINVIVAGGPDVRVPDVRGRTEGAALRILRSCGLDAGRRSEDRVADSRAGQVVRTRPRAGSLVATGSCVDYVVGHSQWYGGRAVRREA